MKRSNLGSTSSITTSRLSEMLAGGIDCVRTKNGVVRGLALRLDLNKGAPEVTVGVRSPYSAFFSR